jgi:hypothetical protein
MAHFLLTDNSVFRIFNPEVAETDMSKPLSKASEGGRFDILGEWEITQSELL